jgi:hypothetical protein
MEVSVRTPGSLVSNDSIEGEAQVTTSFGPHRLGEAKIRLVSESCLAGRKVRMLAFRRGEAGIGCLASG